MKNWTTIYKEITKIGKNHHPLEIDSCFFIKNIINKSNYESLLEIGTGLGFSSFFFANETNIKSIVTLEKNNEYLNNAIKDDTNKVQYINVDAFEYKTDKKFDVIFIDGPKSNQIILFEKFCNNLNDNGVIIIDNIFLNRVKHKTDKKSLKLVNKNNIFIEYLKLLTNFNVKFVNVGDGLAIIKKG